MPQLAQWDRNRRVPRRAFTFRFEIKAQGDGAPVRHEAHTATQALRLARLFAKTGLRVRVRDRSWRRRYLTESELERLARLQEATIRPMLSAMVCPICGNASPNFESDGFDDLVFHCTTHGTFCVARSIWPDFEKLDEVGKRRVVEGAKTRNMTLRYPLVDSLSVDKRTDAQRLFLNLLASH